ncbi:hypothetical protein LXL04_030151 [Taraxacum kok-saghyz]
MMSHVVIGISHQTNIRILVLNNTTITWSHVKQNQCFPYFHLAITCLKQSMEIVNDFDFICRLNLPSFSFLYFAYIFIIITCLCYYFDHPTSSNIVKGFDNLRILNLEDNYIADWTEIFKLSQLKCLEQLHLNKNNIEHIWYPTTNDENSYKPFQNLRCLFIGN